MNIILHNTLPNDLYHYSKIHINLDRKLTKLSPENPIYQITLTYVTKNKSNKF